MGRARPGLMTIILMPLVLRMLCFAYFSVNQRQVWGRQDGEKQVLDVVSQQRCRSVSSPPLHGPKQGDFFFFVYIYCDEPKWCQLCSGWNLAVSEGPARWNCLYSDIRSLIATRSSPFSFVLAPWTLLLWIFIQCYLLIYSCLFNVCFFSSPLFMNVDIHQRPIRLSKGRALTAHLFLKLNKISWSQ